MNTGTKEPNAGSMKSKDSHLTLEHAFFYVENQEKEYAFKHQDQRDRIYSEYPIANYASNEEGLEELNLVVNL